MMKPLYIQPTNDTPTVIFDPEKEIFCMSNRSLPEDAIDFYRPIIIWLEGYCEAPNPVTVFVFKLEYFNTASSKQIIQIISLLAEIATKKEVIVKWHYRDIDEDMLAIGQEYEQLADLKFEFIEHQDRLDY
jgi:hypothetical protein